MKAILERLQEPSNRTGYIQRLFMDLRELSNEILPEDNNTCWVGLNTRWELFVEPADNNSMSLLRSAGDSGPYLEIGVGECAMVVCPVTDLSDEENGIGDAYNATDETG